jgi:hypothetical protein
MEFPATVDEADAPAKTVFERLNEAAAAAAAVQSRLARIRERNLLLPTTHPELCARIAAVMERGVDKPELAEAPAPRRQRKRSLSKVCEAARKAGADRVIVDGVVIALSPAAAVLESATVDESKTVSDSAVSEWDVVLSEGTHGQR